MKEIIELTKSDIEDLVSRYGSLYRIQKELGYRQSSMIRKCKRLGVQFGSIRLRKMNSASQSEVVSKIRELKNLNKVADFYGIEHKAIRVRIERMPEVLRTEMRDILKKDARVHPVDERFFGRGYNQDNMYLAGFIAADGCILEEGAAAYSLFIGLAIKDLEFLKSISSVMRYDNVVEFKTNREFSACKAHIRCTELCHDLMNNFGLYPRKTYDITIPDILLNSDLIRHYIRGVFDGDGTVGLYHKKLNSYDASFGICSASRRFLEQIKSVLDKELDKDVGIIRQDLRDIYSCDFYNYSVSSKKDLVRIRDFFYADASLYLKRKKDIFFDPHMTYARDIPVIATSPDGQETYYENYSAGTVDGFTIEGIGKCVRGVQKHHRNYTFRRAISPPRPLLKISPIN